LRRWRDIDAGLNLRRDFWRSPMVDGLTGNVINDHLRRDAGVGHGCAGDRLKAPTKCNAVSAVLANPSTTRSQEAAAMEMGRNNHCFGN
jgi:hypothetical protein